MSASRANARSRRDWMIPALLIVLSIVPAAAGAARLAEMARGAAITPANVRFFAAPLPAVLHIACVIPYSIVGALQFAPGFRRRHQRWHAVAGRALAACGLVVALSGLWMTAFYPWPEGDGIALYLMRLVFGSFMAVALVLAIAAVRRRDLVAHGSWMTRAYAVGMGAGTQVITHLPWMILFGRPDETMRAVLMGAGWVINLVVAERVIRGASARRRAVRTAAARA